MRIIQCVVRKPGGIAPAFCEALAMATCIRPCARRRRRGERVSRLLLAIEETPCVLSAIEGDPDTAGRAFRLQKADGAHDDVVETRSGAASDCPDFLFCPEGIDPRGYKHVRALVASGLVKNRYAHLESRPWPFRRG